jgi:hypothetical protein
MGHPGLRSYRGPPKFTFSADQVSGADGHQDDVYALVAQSMVEHGAQLRLVADCVVGDENASGHHARYGHVIKGVVSIFLGVEEAESLLRIYAPTSSPQLGR